MRQLTSPAIGATDTGSDDIGSILVSTSESINQNIITRAPGASKNSVSTESCIRCYTSEVVRVGASCHNTGNVSSVLVAARVRVRVGHRDVGSVVIITDQIITLVEVSKYLKDDENPLT
jgi:hypothetical protein